ncbi:TlpA family protein disulfide reductase [Reticulibacter mediterranei]|nr:TlpA disulfide reductase family protein [Reticulibacter mediterranei]
MTENSVEAAIPKKHSRKRRTVVFVTVTIMNGVLLTILGFALLTPAANQSQTTTSKNSFLGDVHSPLSGKPAPDFALSMLTKSNVIVHLTDFKGEVVVLNFWQSFCDPCNTEAPFLQKTWTQIHEQKIVFIGIDVPDTPAAARTFLQKYAITYPNLEDTLDGSISSRYSIDGFPETYFIDQNGIV